MKPKSVIVLATKRPLTLSRNKQNEVVGFLFLHLISIKMDYLSLYKHLPLRLFEAKLWFYIAFLMLPEVEAIAQNEVPFEYNEQISDPYIHVPESQRVWSEPYQVNRAGFVIRQVNVDGNGKNIVGDAANEPSIAIDPGQPRRMAIGWRQFETISSNFRQAGYANSVDGGASWQNQNKVIPWVFRTDPVLEASSNGDFFYNSLSIVNNSIYKCYVHRSADGGALWDEGVYAYGGDKQWMAIDQTADTSNGNIYAIWTTTLSSCNLRAHLTEANHSKNVARCHPNLNGVPSRLVKTNRYMLVVKMHKKKSLCTYPKSHIVHPILLRGIPTQRLIWEAFWCMANRRIRWVFLARSG
jgi:hypothetical protein